MSDIKRGKPSQPNQPIRIYKDKLNEVTYRLIREFKREPITAGKENNNYWVYWVVQWSSNQCAGGEIKTSPPVLEKRRIHVRKDGSLRTSKQGGLTLEDYAWIAQNYSTIAEALQA